jgi:hypothetical protein
MWKAGSNQLLIPPQPQANAALRSAIEMRIFEVFEPNSEPRAAAQLAEQTGVEKLLLGKLLLPL